MHIQKCSQVLFLLLQIYQNIDCDIILIKPSLNTTCPQGGPCFTLTQYANNPSTALQVTLNFLPGTHVLDITFSVTNKEQFSMMASSSSDFPQVVCTSTGNLSLSFTQVTLIKGISFHGCGHNVARTMGSFTMQDSRFLNSTTMYNGAIWSVSSSTTVVIENCTFANNVVHRGGTLSVNMVSNLTVLLCTFENNKIAQEYNDGGALLITKTNSFISLSAFSNNQVRRGGEGGAVYIKGGNTTVSHSSFTNNQVNGSSGEGGAVYITNANSVFQNSFFTNNQAVGFSSRGGALYVYGQNLMIFECTFASNQINGPGGALYIWNTIIAKINNSKFMSNGANGIGGAVYIWRVSSVIIRESMFMSNEARGSSSKGGALYITRAYSTEISASNFTENQVGRGGGAIYVTNTRSSIYNCIFASNQAGGSNYGEGGAMHIRDSNSEIHDSIFTDNQARGSSGEGGAIYINDANSTITDSIFMNNQVDDISGEGAALYFELSFPSSSIFLSLKLCIFKKNRAGLSETSGIVHVHASSYWRKRTLSIIIAHCQFFGNNGEAVYTYNVSKLSIHSSDFADGRAPLISERPIRQNSHGELLVNQSSFRGNTGAIKGINIKHIKIYNSNFSNNTANDREGGAVFVTGKNIDVLLSHNTFSKSTATSCGVLSVGNANHDSTRQTYDAKISLVSNKFSYNNATGKTSGGAVACFRNALVTIDGCSFNGNLANSNGGAFHANESFITIEGSTFINNAASNDGGIGHVVNSSLVVRDSTFHNNSALNVGSVFAIRNGLVAIDRNIFYSNRADGEGEVVYFYPDTDDFIFVKIEDNRFLDHEVMKHRRILLARNYSVESDDLFQTSCICYCSTTYVISRTFAAARNSNNCTVCSLLNEKFAEIAKCLADYNSTTSPGIESGIQGHVNTAALSVSVVFIFLIATMVVVAVILINKRSKMHSLSG